DYSTPSRCSSSPMEPSGFGTWRATGLRRPNNGWIYIMSRSTCTSWLAPSTARAPRSPAVAPAAPALLGPAQRWSVGCLARIGRFAPAPEESNRLSARGLGQGNWLLYHPPQAHGLQAGQGPWGTRRLRGGRVHRTPIPNPLQMHWAVLDARRR